VIKGSGSRAENETVILFNDADPTALIETASPTVYRRLLKRGWVPASETRERARFEVPKDRVRLPGRPKVRSSREPGKSEGHERKKGVSGEAA
jgi:hypothetical protein